MMERNLMSRGAPVIVQGPKLNSSGTVMALMSAGEGPYLTSKAISDARSSLTLHEKTIYIVRDHLAFMNAHMGD